MREAYAQVEAFCLMKYASDDGSEVEWVWNSRDGVTPFVIRSRSGKEMTHVDWLLDTRLPAEFIPPKGMRIFVDLTPERAREFAARNVEAMLGDSPGYQPAAGRHIRDQNISKEAAIKDLAKSYLERSGSPDLIEATGEPLARSRE
jgi:hypothetical protein